MDGNVEAPFGHEGGLLGVVVRGVVGGGAIAVASSQGVDVGSVDFEVGCDGSLAGLGAEVTRFHFIGLVNCGCEGPECFGPLAVLQGVFLA